MEETKKNENVVDEPIHKRNLLHQGNLLHTNVKTTTDLRKH